MLRAFYFLVASSLLASCGIQEASLSKEEIERLCKMVGDKAFAEANVGNIDYQSLKWIEDGARAECELKYRSEK